LPVDGLSSSFQHRSFVRTTPWWRVRGLEFVLLVELKGTKISIRRLIRSNVRRCAASSHHGRKDVGVRSSVPRFLHRVAPRVGYDFDGNTRSLIIA
jgi:hypothetical protein